CRRSACLLAERRDDAAQLEMQLLHAPGQAHRPPAVAEVAFQLAQDGRGRERRELEPAAGIEPLDGLEQADQRDLHEVVARLAAVREAGGEEVRERSVVPDELVAQTAVAGAAVGSEARVDACAAPNALVPASHPTSRPSAA